MAEPWKRRSTSKSVYVETDLSDFDADQLLQALIDMGTISEAEAVAIKARGGFKSQEEGVPIIAMDADHVDDAWNELIRGRRAEALHHLERALGNQWIGRLSS